MLFLATILKKMLGLSRMSLAAISTTAIPLTSHLSSPAFFSVLTAESTALLLIDRGSVS